MKSKLQLAKEAIDLVVPAAYELFLSDRTKGQDDIFIVVMDPLSFPWEGNKFEEAILYETFIGEEEDAQEYKDIARHKAMKAWRLGLPDLGDSVPPATLGSGDTVYGLFRLQGNRCGSQRPSGAL